MKELLGDYDAIHVRRGDLLKNRKDRFGVERSLHPHLDRDTRPEYIRKRIAKWIPPGRTLYIASNERTPGFFSSLSDRYYMHCFSNCSCPTKIFGVVYISIYIPPESRCMVWHFLVSAFGKLSSVLSIFRITQGG